MVWNPKELKFSRNRWFHPKNYFQVAYGKKIEERPNLQLLAERICIGHSVVVRRYDPKTSVVVGHETVDLNRNTKAGFQHDSQEWVVVCGVVVKHFPVEQLEEHAIKFFEGINFLNGEPTVRGTGTLLALNTKHEGIRVGEVQGWRVWWLAQDGVLRSGYVPYRWDEIRPANIEAAGYFAFKDCERALGIAQGYARTPPERDDIVVYGQVYMWGEVVEHSSGYRSEYAWPNAETLKAFPRVCYATSINEDRAMTEWIPRRAERLEECKERYRVKEVDDGYRDA